MLTWVIQIQYIKVKQENSSQKSQTCFPSVTPGPCSLGPLHIVGTAGVMLSLVVYYNSKQIKRVCATQCLPSLRVMPQRTSGQVMPQRTLVWTRLLVS